MELSIFGRFHALSARHPQLEPSAHYPLSRMRAAADRPSLGGNASGADRLGIKYFVAVLTAI